MCSCNVRILICAISKLKLKSSAHDVALSKQHKSISASDIFKALELVEFNHLSPMLESQFQGKQVSLPSINVHPHLFLQHTELYLKTKKVKRRMERGHRQHVRRLPLLLLMAQQQHRWCRMGILIPMLLDFLIPIPPSRQTTTINNNNNKMIHHSQTNLSRYLVSSKHLWT